MSAEQQPLRGQIITAHASRGQDDRTQDCIINDCGCDCHEDAPWPAGIYVTIQLEGDPRIGVGGRFELVEAEELAALLAQRDAVLKLHRKMPLWGHEDRCTDATDDHREERHELIDGEFWCRDIVDDWTCAECAELMDGGLGEHPAWPCSTRKALEVEL